MAAQQQHNIEHRAWELDDTDMIINNSLYNELKEFFMNEAIWGEDVARRARGPGLAAVIDTPAMMYARIREDLATIDDEAERSIKAFYTRFGRAMLRIALIAKLELVPSSFPRDSSILTSNACNSCVRSLATGQRGG
jgi:hypothetical protein